MAKQIQIRIFADGKVKTTTSNMKGKVCLKYISLLEELLEAKTLDSEFTKEYYENEEQLYHLDQLNEYTQERG